MPKPTDPTPTVQAVDRRLTEVARILRSANIADNYRAQLRRESDQLLDKRVLLRASKLLDVG